MPKKKQKKVVSNLKHLSTLLDLIRVIHGGAGFPRVAIDILNAEEKLYLLGENPVSELKEKNKMFLEQKQIGVIISDADMTYIERHGKILLPNGYKLRETVKFCSDEFRKDVRIFLVRLHVVIDSCDKCIEKYLQTKEDEKKEGKLSHFRFSFHQHFYDASTTGSRPVDEISACLERLKVWIEHANDTKHKGQLRKDLQVLESKQNTSMKSELFSKLKNFADRKYFCKINNSFSKSRRLLVFFVVLGLLFYLFWRIMGDSLEEIIGDSCVILGRIIIVAIVLILSNVAKLSICKKASERTAFFNHMKNAEPKLVSKIIKCFAVLTFLMEEKSNNSFSEGAQEFFDFFKGAIESKLSFLKELVSKKAEFESAAAKLPEIKPAI